MRNVGQKIDEAKAFGKRALAPKAVSKIAGLFALGFLSSCQGGLDSVLNVAEKPLPTHLLRKMKAKDMSKTSPIMLRIFKTENVMEVWKAKKNGRFALLETYEICKWSGKLGPKFKEGDRQAPEGFYQVGRPQMNPNSKYHLSFNIGFPNTFDRSHGRTGTHLMVHGACSSAGCYSMTDELVEEIYGLAREAFKGGQKKFQVQAYPFRMTPANMAKNVQHPHYDFWKMLKEGYDHFEITKYPVKVDVCEKRYSFNRIANEGEKFSSKAVCPQVTMPNSLLLAYSQKRSSEMEAFSKALNLRQLSAKVKGEALSLTPSQMTLVSKATEILPPPTPKPVVVPEAPAVSTAQNAEVEAGANPQTQVLSGAQNNALFEAQNNAANTGAAQTSQNNQNNQSNRSNQSAVAAQNQSSAPAAAQQAQNGPEIILIQPLPRGNAIPIPLPANR
ncbi:MAG: hypothetical protein AB8B49_04225 [Nitratireductor sp.]